MMDFVWFLLVGLCAGWLAARLAGRRGLTVWQHLVVGVIGAIVGGFLLRILGFASVHLLGELITATAGALMFLWVVRAVMENRGRRRRRGRWRGR